MARKSEDDSYEELDNEEEGRGGDCLRTHLFLHSKKTSISGLGKAVGQEVITP